MQISISEDIHSLSDFKRNTPELLDQMRESGRPVVLTINGKAEIVVQDAASYQMLLDRMEEIETLAGIKRGLADMKAGRVTPLESSKRSFGASMDYSVALADSAKADADRSHRRRRASSRSSSVRRTAAIDPITQADATPLSPLARVPQSPLPTICETP